MDFVTGLSPVISIEQKTTVANPRSTVGTMTDISDYLRMLFARLAWSTVPIVKGTNRQTEVPTRSTHPDVGAHVIVAGRTEVEIRHRSSNSMAKI
ncbi:MAG: hypothetical protein R2932_16935 [Caldilineaceae bacterium]